MNDALAAVKGLSEFAKNAPPPNVLFAAGLRWLQDLCMAEIMRRGPGQPYLDSMEARGWSEEQARSFWQWAVVDSFNDARTAAAPSVWPEHVDSVPYDVRQIGEKVTHG